MIVLCVDDELRATSIICKILDDHEYTTFAINNPLEVMPYLVENVVDIVITDIKMPQLNGIELLKLIKKFNPDIEVIITTGHGDIDTAISAIRYKAANFIPKPYSAPDLLMMVNQVKDLILLHRENDDYKNHLESLVKERTEKLMKAERLAMVGRMSAYLAHNLNSSLMGIMGSSQLLDIKLKDKDSFVQRQIQILNESSQKMKQIIGDTMTRIRMEQQIEKHDFSLNSMIKNHIGLIGNHSHKIKEIKIIADLDDNLPLFKAIYSDFSQILDNLFSNSIDALDNSVKKEIQIKTQLKKNSIFLIFSDTGHGIDPSHIKKLFNPDFTTKELGKGTGLGLASVKELLDSYKATIDVKSKLNVITEFTIEIPLDVN